MKNLLNLSLLNSNGLARDGLAYGALTDLPDWSFVGKLHVISFLQQFFSTVIFTIVWHLYIFCNTTDGEPAPESKRRKKRQNNRIQESVSRALNEVHVSKTNFIINMHKQCFQILLQQRIMQYLKEVDQHESLVSKDKPWMINQTLAQLGKQCLMFNRVKLQNRMHGWLMEWPIIYKHLFWL